MGAYVVAVFAMLLSGGSALALCYVVRHFDRSACETEGNRP